MRGDVIIVGAGVYGCALAWELARRGRDVLVLEAEQIASGASGGLGQRGVRANGRDVRELALMRRAHSVWPSLADALGAETGFERIGHLELTEQPDSVVHARERCDQQRRHGIPTELVDGSALRELEPDVADGVCAAFYCPSDGTADHTATTRAYAAAAQRCGARFVEGMAVVQLCADAGRVRSLVTAGEDRIDVGTAVIVLANQNVAPLIAPLGTQITTFPTLPQVLITEPLPRRMVRHLIGHAHRRLALKTLPTGAVMITGGWLGKWNAARGIGEPVAEHVAGNLADAVAVYPSLGDAVVAVAVADRTESIAPDLLPIIDAVSSAPNCLFATGWSGHGWAIAPAVAELIATWVITERRPPLLAPFSLSRFA